MPRPILFLDIDGVLADFVSPTLRLFGRADLLEPKRWPPAEYSIEKLLGVSTNHLWKRIDEAGPEFWSELPVYPWTADLYTTCQALGEVYLLSAPSLSPHSAHGKRIWMQRVFGSGFTNYILTSHKHLLGKPGRILIDDNDRNVHEFKHAGGHGIVFPRPWNILHKLAPDPVTSCLKDLRYLLQIE